MMKTAKNGSAPARSKPTLPKGADGSSRPVVLRIVLISAIAAVLVICLAVQPLLLAGIAFIVLLRCVRRRRSSTHGSAYLASRKDFEKAGMLEEGNGFILGRALPERPPLIKSVIDLLRMPWNKSELACSNLKAAVLGARFSGQPLLRLKRYVHLLVVAPAGAGKGVGLIIPNLLMHDGSVVVTDPKGENYQKSANRRKRMEHEVHRLDPFAVCGEGASSLNPLALLDPRSPRLISDCRALAESLVVKTGQENDPHWNDCAVDCLTAFSVYVVTADAPIEEKNLLTVRRLIADPLAFAGALSEMTNSDVAEGALRTLGQQILGWGNDREKSSILSTCNRHLAFLDSPLVSRSLATSSFDTADLVRRKMSIYFVLPPDQLVPLARLNRLWLTCCFTRLAQGPLQEKNTVLFVLDEAGSALEKLPALEQAVTLLRGFGARILIVTQALSQLARLFPGEKGFQTVQANMDQVFFGIRDLETAREVSAWIGQTTVQSRSSQHSTATTRPTLFSAMSARGSNANSTVSTTEGVTYADTGRALIQPEEILRLPDNIALVLAKGIAPFAAQVVRYYSDPAFSEALAEQSIVERRASAVATDRQQLVASPKKLALNCPKCRASLRYSPAKPGKQSRCPVCCVKVFLRQRLGQNGKQRH
jgi:type IV secretion system protein VirD4